MNKIENNPRLARAVEGLGTLLDLRLRDVMQTDVISLEVEDLLATAARTLIENKINAVVVLKDKKVYSILSSWDLLHLSYLEAFSDKLDYLKSPLSEVIDEPGFESLEPDATLAETASLMARTNFRTIPVIDGDKLVGVFSIMDLVRTYHRLILEDR